MKFKERSGISASVRGFMQSTAIREVGDKETSIIEGVRFFGPSEELTRRIVEEIESAEENEAGRIGGSPEDCEVGDPVLTSSEHEFTGDRVPELGGNRRLLAEELYFYLATLAATPAAQNGEPLNIRNSAIKCMANSMGLSGSSDLVFELANEFEQWIAELGDFKTGWGTILWASNGCIYLSEFATNLEESSVAPTRFFKKYNSKKLLK